MYSSLSFSFTPAIIDVPVVNPFSQVPLLKSKPENYYLIILPAVPALIRV